ncbi:tryptophan-rich sensory protein [Psychrobacillus soli]|uniref:Tryptophan-rich sensory protein n=1 Tax=Psychrobacillus soli TaxID=1543965 RepID=A0A544TCT5_9BACI|nr:tryptophan-rich sensory protein [Psychrobacillus soli]TQR15287.1 tryptophan-rich sensory protein [Psychrobacillus soli]
MVKIILLILSLISTITVHILANTLPINGQTTESILNRLPLFFTPAHYVFFIWIIIYLLSASWIWNSIKEYQATRQLPLKRVLLFAITSIFHITWILFWHFELFNYSLISMFVLLGTLFLLYMTYPVKEQNWMSRLPISIYFGWIIIEMFINLDYLSTYYEFSGLGITKSLWTVIFLTIATAIALHFRYHYEDRAIVVVFIWTFLGLAVRHLFNELLISTASLFLSSVLVAGIFFIKKTPSKE